MLPSPPSQSIVSILASFHLVPSTQLIFPLQPSTHDPQLAAAPRSREEPAFIGLVLRSSTDSQSSNAWQVTDESDDDDDEDNEIPTRRRHPSHGPPASRHDVRWLTTASVEDCCTKKIFPFKAAGTANHPPRKATGEATVPYPQAGSSLEALPDLRTADKPYSKVQPANPTHHIQPGSAQHLTAPPHESHCSTVSRTI
ncbi:hypothetical protein IFR05_012381 [Cadophora sp. M221]|nr:hypothetical protein IFR05_012381 [Cadophora sp. M221]